MLSSRPSTEALPTPCPALRSRLSSVATTPFLCVPPYWEAALAGSQTGHWGHLANSPPCSCVLPLAHSLLCPRLEVELWFPSPPIFPETGLSMW